MATNAIHFTIHETYDLNTAVDAITLLAIRTPSFATVGRYVDLRNWKKIKFNKCDFRLACVSHLPVDPLGVGFEPGQIAPQELVNPMLFKTVTGESLGAVLDVIYGTNRTNQDGGLKELKVKSIVVDQTSSSEILAPAPLDMYYTLLGDDSFRQSHPQMGLDARGLIPLVREMYSTFPLSDQWKVGIGSLDGTVWNRTAIPRFVEGTGQVEAQPSIENGVAYAVNRIISGKTVPLPAFDIWPSSKASGNVTNPIDWPVSYVGLCVMPPAIQKSFYYRCIVSWNISLIGFEPLFRSGAGLITNDDHIYNNWIEVPVSSSVAEASELMDTNGLLATDGVENVRLVTTNLT